MDRYAVNASVAETARFARGVGRGFSGAGQNAAGNPPGGADLMGGFIRFRADPAGEPVSGIRFVTPFAESWPALLRRVRARDAGHVLETNRRTSHEAFACSVPAGCVRGG